jgi:hypothetical protein
MKGRIEGNAVEPMSMKSRHDELEAEIVKRAIAAGRKPPCSPFEQPDLSHYPARVREYKIDVEAARTMLIERCYKCRKRHIEHGIFVSVEAVENSQ